MPVRYFLFAFLQSIFIWSLWSVANAGDLIQDKAEIEKAKRESCENVEVSGVTVACFAKGVGTFTAKERAKAVRERLIQLSLEPSFDPESLELKKHFEYVDIAVGNLVITSLFSDDLESQDESSKLEKAEAIRIQMKAAISAHRALTSPTRLIQSTLYFALATAVLIILLYIMRGFYRNLYEAIERSHGRYIKSLRIQTFELLNANRIIAIVLWAAQVSRVIFTAILVYIYIPLVLSFFPWTSNWAPKLLSYIMDPLKTISSVIVDFIPNLFFIAVIIVLTRYLMKFTHFLFREIELGNLQINGFYKEWADPTYKLVRGLIIAFAFVMSFPYLPGSSSPAFQGISVFLGLLLSLGSSSAIANVVAGIVLTYMRPFKAGDRVKIADTTGDIIEKTLLVTRIKTIKNVEITVPNSMVLGSHIINYSSTAEAEGLILTTSITVGYDIPWRKVHELLKEAAERTELVLKDKKPFILQTALNDFYAAYELNAFTNAPNKMAIIYSHLHQNIQDCFVEAGIELTSPHFRAMRGGETAKSLASPPTILGLGE